MNKSANPHDPLERLVDAALRDLPPRRAPRTLEMRVLAEIEQRLSLSWWQRSYAHWPLAARALFLSACVVVGTVVVRAAGWLFTESSSAWHGVKTELAPTATSIRATADVFSFIAHNVPSAWIYGLLALMAIMYVTLFGIGAAAYRTVYSSR
ncbi:MAG TPA: hypothetical protein VKB34_04205 [Povalibacter sp.]|nr:hypothetical protein [Povalibacter sp.]